MEITPSSHCSFCCKPCELTVTGKDIIVRICPGCVADIVKFLAEKSLLPPGIIFRDKFIDDLTLGTFMSASGIDGHEKVSAFIDVYCLAICRIVCAKDGLEKLDQAIAGLEKEKDDLITKKEKLTSELIDRAFE
ncbi:MAG: hypothetical protein ABR875_01915 [Minisyncoccia bacterium]|jgi:hypothetical protein